MERIKYTTGNDARVPVEIVDLGEIEGHRTLGVEHEGETIGRVWFEGFGWHWQAEGADEPGEGEHGLEFDAVDALVAARQ